MPRGYAILDGDKRWVFLDGEVYEIEVPGSASRRPGSGRRRASAHHGSLSAPMPATVVKVNTQVGAKVTRGETLLVLEAMKMELPVRATSDGTVTAVNCKVGELVQPGASLVEIE
jgi:biotin carboxyl carrier protein